MEIKVKSVKAKEASVSISVDVKSAEVLNEFLSTAMEDIALIERTAEAFGIDVSEVSELICGIISGLDGE